MENDVKSASTSKGGSDGGSGKGVFDDLGGMEPPNSVGSGRHTHPKTVWANLSEK